MKHFLALLCCLLSAGCNSSPPPSQPALIFARGADSQKLDPADVDDGESIKVLVNVCEGLVRFKPGTTQVEPCLAASWMISDDGLTYDFTLREGVTFHDGTPLDATTAAFSFLRQHDKSHPARPPTAVFAYWSAMFSMVESIDVTDKMRLRFRLREPHAPFLSSLAIPAASLISPKFIDQRHPVGTGPFRFIAWTPNETIILESNPNYWHGPSQVARLIFKVVPDSATRLIQLQSGQIHAMDGVDPHDLTVIQQDASLRLLATAGMNVCYLAFNCARPPLDDVALRRAIASAINKPDIINIVYRGAAIPALNPLPPFIPGHNDSIGTNAPASPATFSVPSAPLRLHVMTNPRPYLPNPVRAAELIKADLEKIGVAIEIVLNEWGSHLSRTGRGEHDLALLGWVGDNGDADNFLYVLLDKDTAALGSALNITYWNNDAYHDLMLAARRETNAETRADLYRRAQEIIFVEAPMVPLAHAQSMVATRAGVQGVLLQPNGDILFHRATLGQ